jgi:uncharacterized membrane protein
MTKTRLEAFSDGVIAIIITIMVLELRPPEDSDWHSLTTLLPVFLSYVLSFIYLGIYWNNHHHMLHATERVNGAVLWANLHLLFWLSLTPFATAYMGDYHRSPLPNALYGTVLLCAAFAYTILQGRILRAQGPHSRLAAMLGSDVKGKISLVLYVLGIASAFVNTWLSSAFYVVVAMIWLIPDRRIEKHLG